MSAISIRPLPYVLYDEDGIVTATGYMQEGIIEKMQEAGERIVVGEGGLGTHYVLNRKIYAKEPSNVTLNGRVLSNLPNPSTILIRDPDGMTKSYPNRASQLELVFNYPGEYRVTVRSKKFLDAGFVVNEEASA